MTSAASVPLPTPLLLCCPWWPTLRLPYRLGFVALLAMAALHMHRADSAGVTNVAASPSTCSACCWRAAARAERAGGVSGSVPAGRALLPTVARDAPGASSSSRGFVMPGWHRAAGSTWCGPARGEALTVVVRGASCALWTGELILVTSRRAFAGQMAKFSISLWSYSGGGQVPPVAGAILHLAGAVAIGLYAHRCSSRS